MIYEVKLRRRVPLEEKYKDHELKGKVTHLSE